MSTMPFGCYRGWRLDALPDDYVAWLLTLDDLRAPLRAALRDEHERRQSARDHHQASRRRRACPAPALADELIGVGLRTLAHRYHPDAGGTHDHMVQVTAAADWLRAQVRELSA